MKINKKTQEATILNRYKRFLADVVLKNGEEITVHVANTGRMTSCWDKGWKCLISDSENPKRKLRYSLELTNNGKTWIVVNTNTPNEVAEDFIKNEDIASLKGYKSIRREVKYGTNSRIDLLLENANEKCYVEVKNTTLVENGIAMFPDAPSERGRKHLKELIEVVKQGHRAVMLYMVSREDASLFKAATHIDPDYAKELVIAHNAGVEILAVLCNVSPEEITFNKILKYKI